MIFYKNMESTKINIVNVIGDTYGVEAGDGQKVYELIKKAFDQKHKVVLSFQNMSMLTTAFLNTAVGQLYKDYEQTTIRGLLQLDGLSDSGKVSLKRVVEAAKKFYNDPEALQKSIDDILGE